MGVPVGLPVLTPDQPHQLAVRKLDRVRLVKIVVANPIAQRDRTQFRPRLPLVRAPNRHDAPRPLLAGHDPLLAEIQQSSNATYRVYDYNRTDSSGRTRPLHIEKALDVIDFNSAGRIPRFRGLNVDIGNGFVKRYLAAGSYFCMELYDVEGQVQEKTENERFYIYLILEGKAAFEYSCGLCEAVTGESVLIPACLDEYTISGQFSALKFYIPDIAADFIQPLKNAGYGREEILENVGGIIQENFR